MNAVTVSQAATIVDSAGVVFASLSRVIRSPVYLTAKHKVTMDSRGTLVGYYRKPLELADLIADAMHVAETEIDGRTKPESSYRRSAQWSPSGGLKRAA